MSHEINMIKNSRRDFLKFIGNAGISIAALQATSLGAGLLLSRQAEASGVIPRRIIFVYIPDGTPEGAAKSYTPSANLTLNKCSLPLESVKQQCVFLKDVFVDAGNGTPDGAHGNTQRVLGAFAKGVKGTIDLALEGVIGATSPVASLRLGVNTRNSDLISARGYTLATDYQDNPKAAFEKLFGGTIDASPIGSKRERKILDINQTALNAIKNKLGTYEKQRLDQHQAAISKLQTDINAAANSAAPAGCVNPTWNANGFSMDMTANTFSDTFALQTENILLAMKCNITRIATLQLGNHSADFGVTGLRGNYHGAVHDGDLAFYATYRSYFSERMTYLIKRLSETEDPNGGKLIDNTLILQVTDMGDGGSHTGTDAAFMFAGGGQAINRGKIITAGSHNNLLDTVAQYMGVYGAIPAYGSGPVSGILL